MSCIVQGGSSKSSLKMCIMNNNIHEFPKKLVESAYYKNSNYEFKSLHQNKLNF